MQCIYLLKPNNIRPPDYPAKKWAEIRVILWLIRRNSINISLPYRFSSPSSFPPAASFFPLFCT